MASQFPLAPVAGQQHFVSGVIYEYDAALGWVKYNSALPVPTAPTTYTRGIAQFTTAPFGFSEIYENIFDAYQNNTGILRQAAGTPAWNITSYDTTTWNGLFMLNIVKSTTTGNPCAIIDVPAGAVGGLMWLRHINDDQTTARENKIRYRAAGSGAAGLYQVNTWVDNQANNITFGPHSYMTNAGGEMSYNHQWLPVVLPPGATQIEMELVNEGTTDGWFSGIAFTDNPRGWASTNAITLHRQFTDGIYNGGTDFSWDGIGGGFPRVNFTGRTGDGEATAPVNRGAGPKRFATQCDVNGNNKRVCIMVYMDSSPVDWQFQPHLRAAGGTWIPPEQAVMDIDWVTLALTKTPNFTFSWTYEIPAAEIAAAATVVNDGGGTLANLVMLEMFQDSTASNSIAHVFTYDA